MAFTPEVTVKLPEHLWSELAQIAAEKAVSEAELAEEAIERLVQSYRGPAVPRYARRLGPMAIR